MKDYIHLTIEELHQAYLNNEVTPLEVVTQVLDEAEKDTNNAYEYICKERALEQAKNLKEEDKGNILWGIPYVLKDNYSTKDIPTCASSNILEGYVPIYSSEVFDKLEKAGAILIGKTTLDELAMGGTGTSGHLGKTFNPYDPTHERMIGGSSCGSAATVSSGYIPFSIGSDTGDSVRKPASYSGLVGFKPTWGRISRYGLFPFAPSLDHVGYFTRSVKDAASLLNILAVYDEKDATTSSKEVKDYTKGLDGNLKGYKIAVIDEILNSITDKTVIEEFNKTLKILEKEGAVLSHVSMDIDLVKAIYPTYVIISCCEATSNDANLDGLKFGLREDGKTYEEIMTNTRTKGFSTLIKRRFVIGGYSLLKENQQELFLRAQKARHLIVDAFNKIYEEYDLIYLPAAPSIAPKFSDASDTLSDEYLISDNYLAFANFGGYPSLTLPIGFEAGMPLGGNISGRIFEEDKVLNASLAIEKNLPYYNLYAKKETK
ncbi:MAG: aspartyl/glutamyl-tRNA amidotransferase subunit A [Coprobacillus sp.]|nr:aspartyl/glutamyl-tRNA amidotransferase subunit A [Coprobacillus sp.]